MHVESLNRGKGTGRSLVSHVLEFARSGGVERVSLETSPDEAFAPARKLYASLGFTDSGSFADYSESPTSVFMTIAL